MSSPMYDLPEHLRIGVTGDGQGPVDPLDIDFDHYACWCGEEGCLLYQNDADDPLPELEEPELEPAPPEVEVDHG